MCGSKKGIDLEDNLFICDLNYLRKKRIEEFLRFWENFLVN